jgi:NAD+ synthase (glutamine-hydrolysing)
MRIFMAQINTVVGDFAGNAERCSPACVRRLSNRPGAGGRVPELTLSGYPPEDLLLRPSLAGAWTCWRWNCWSRPAASGLGHRRLSPGPRWQACTTAPACCTRQLVAEYRKRELPNYQVFDEKRYFSAGDAPCVVDIGGVPVGLTYLRGYLGDGARGRRREAGAELLINLNASPYHRGKQDERLELVCQRAATTAWPYCVRQPGGRPGRTGVRRRLLCRRRGRRVASLAPRFETALQWLRGRRASHGGADRALASWRRRDCRTSSPPPGRRWCSACATT